MEMITGVLELAWQAWCPLEQCSHMLTWTTPSLSVQILRWITQLVFLPFMTSSSTNFHKCTISFNKKCSEQKWCRKFNWFNYDTCADAAFWHVCMGNEFDKFWQAKETLALLHTSAFFLGLGLEIWLVFFYFWGGMCWYSVHFWRKLLGWPYGLVTLQKCIAFHKWIQ